MHLKSIFFILGIIFFSSTTIFAQEDQEAIDEEEVEYQEEYVITRAHLLEFGISLVHPISPFARDLPGSNLFGFQFSAYSQLRKEKPLFLGLEYYYTHIGSLQKSYEANVGVQFIDLDGNVTSNMMGINAVLRYYIPRRLWKLEPFVSGSLGLKWMYSYLSEQGIFFSGDVYDNFDFQESDFTLAVGGTIGTQIRLVDQLYLYTSVQYHNALSGEYFAPLDQEAQDQAVFPEEGFRLQSGSTPWIRYNIGITYLFL